jgi:hypothetical protein
VWVKDCLCQVQTAAVLMQFIVVSEFKYYNFRTNGGGDGDDDDDDGYADDDDDICTSITMYKLNDGSVRHKTSRYIP